MFTAMNIWSTLAIKNPVLIFEFEYLLEERVGGHEQAPQSEPAAQQARAQVLAAAAILHESPNGDQAREPIRTKIGSCRLKRSRRPNQAHRGQG